MGSALAPELVVTASGCEEPACAPVEVFGVVFATGVDVAESVDAVPFEVLPLGVGLPLGALLVGVRGVPVVPLDATEFPTTFVAIAENVYSVPFVKPEIVHDVAGGVTVHVNPPGCAVTVYESTGPPPEPGVTEITALLSPGCTEIVGALGNARGVDVTPVDAADDPVPLDAVAENVYSVPLVKPEIVHDVRGDVTVHVNPPGCAVTV